MKILLVRLREIGDVVFTTPAIRGVRQRFPDAAITYVVEPPAAAVVANNPHLDQLVVAPRKRGLGGLCGEVALIRRLRSQRFDVAIDFHGGPRASLLTWMSGAPVRIGYTVAGRSWMYTRRVARPRALRRRHSVENQWDLLAALDISPPDREHHPMEMPADLQAVREVDVRLKAAGLEAADRVVVVHVSAGNPFRRWPLASFASVVAALAGPAGRHVVVTSGPSERDAREHVIAEARGALAEPARRRVLGCGEFSLAELRALMDRASLYVGGDSGPMHVAATSAVPIVTLYGPTLPARSAPWRPPQLVAEAVEAEPLDCRPCEQRACVHGDFRCLAWIQPRQVLEAADRALARASG